MCFDGDACDVWDRDERKARKAYKCDECGAPIPVGVKYLRIGTLFEGSWSTLRVHCECMKLWERVHEKLCEGRGLIMVGGLWEELQDYGIHSRDVWPYRMRYEAIRRKYNPVGVAS